MAAADEREITKKSTVREYYEALLIAIIFVNFVRIFAFQAFKIPTGSMEDNLKVGDHIIVNKFIFGANGSALLEKLLPLRGIRRGDIIVFRYPEVPEQDFVKRVIALPGDTIQIDAKRVFVNGIEAREPYALHIDRRIIPNEPFLPDKWRRRDHFAPFRVPAGHYFAMGDNRDNSYDSRFWGPVPREMIKGRAFMVYWSFDPVTRPLTAEASPFDRIRELAGVTRHFFSRTRWQRSFFIIDSKYHYTPGVTAYGSEY